jgi:hypothetical protein
MFQNTSYITPLRIALVLILVISTLTFVLTKPDARADTTANSTAKNVSNFYAPKEEDPIQRPPLPEDVAVRSEQARNKGFISSGESALSLMSTFSCNNVSVIPKAECEALISLYNATNGPGWYDRTGWLETNDPCNDWFGIICNEGHVVELWLLDNDMVGQIPTDIGNLPYLYSLDFGYNQLSSTIPAEIWTLSKLLFLYLDYNQLSGSIPNEIGNLKDLLGLLLNDNSFTGPIPSAIGYLTYLEVFDISYNHFYGEIPFQITSLLNLSFWTDIGYNHLYSINPKVIAFLNEQDPYWQDTQSPIGTFFDVLPGYWAESFIDAIYDASITGGCKASPILFCPNAPVYRGDMAIFLERGMKDSDFTPPIAIGIFTDVPLNVYYANWVEQLYADGVTGGCSVSPLKYCPSSKVTRAQMAVFLLKAKYGKEYSPPAAEGIFSDVQPGSFFEPWIEQLSVEGITAGCGSGIYCPSSPVTRAQMAVFLTRTFGLPIP